MRTARLCLFSATLVFAVAVPASAQTPGSRPTREFVNAAAQSDQFEIFEAESALAQSENPDVRAFATEMIRDHQQSSQTLKDAATRSGLESPQPGISGDQSALLAALQSARGHDFDVVYARHQALAHRSALAIQQGYAMSGDDPNLRQVATTTTQLIRSHISMADDVAAKIGDK
jgi:putative membrane protein